MLIDVKMPTIVGIIVGILIFMIKIKLMLSLVEHEHFFNTLGPGMAILSLLLNSNCDNGLYRFRRNKLSICLHTCISSRCTDSSETYM